MTLPNWNHNGLKAGTMIRTALWLMSEVGIGNTFTKEQLRAAFSGVSQADRRLRDLRDYGWVIHTSAEDISLNPEEQRLVAIGLPVWERGARKKLGEQMVSSKARKMAFAASDYQCATCGIAGGETYPDAPHRTAVLAASRQKVQIGPGEQQIMIVPQCKRCRAGEAMDQLEISALVAKIRTLNIPERELFMRWTKRGRTSPLDQVWSAFRRAPLEAKDMILKELSASR